MSPQEKKALEGVRRMLNYAVFMVEQGIVYPEAMNQEHINKLLKICREDFEGSLRFASIWEEEPDGE